MPPPKLTPGQILDKLEALGVARRVELPKPPIADADVVDEDPLERS